jgi:hypothetical protein
MESQRIAKLAVGSIVTLGAIFLLGVFGSSPRLQAQSASDDYEASLIDEGLEIAPVHLNLVGKDRNLVGLGSYLVNAVGDCNGCHSSGAAPLGFYPYVTGKNPYFHQPAKVDPTVYLAGGGTFGSLGIIGTPTGLSGYAGPAIISRNLTPDKNGRPAGGHTLAEFKEIIRHGTDFDHVHPTCTAAQLADIIQNNTTPVCTPTGTISTPGLPDYQNNVDGNLLQIMPWPTFSHMTDHDIEAIYEYLSAIPCIDNNFSTGPAGDPNELRNDCGK